MRKEGRERSSLHTDCKALGSLRRYAKVESCTRGSPGRESADTREGNKEGGRGWEGGGGGVKGSTPGFCGGGLPRGGAKGVTRKASTVEAKGRAQVEAEGAAGSSSLSLSRAEVLRVALVASTPPKPKPPLLPKLGRPMERGEEEAATASGGG